MLAERIENWFDEATRQGIRKGRMEGEARLLAKLLERRFGPLPPVVADRLTQATEAEIESWGEAMLSTTPLAAVFEPPHH